MVEHEATFSQAFSRQRHIRFSGFKTNKPRNANVRVQQVASSLEVVAVD